MMRENDLTIIIEASITRGTARPVTVRWSVSALADEPAESVGRAITEACRKLNTTLKEAVK